MGCFKTGQAPSLQEDYGEGFRRGKPRLYRRIMERVLDGASPVSTGGFFGRLLKRTLSPYERYNNVS
jgi:hypothetical protein